MDISTVREAIAAAASAATSTPALTCTGFAPDAITEPHFYVGDYTIDYDQTYSRSETVEFTCGLMVGRPDDRSAQKLLDGYLSRSGPASVKAAIEAARGAPGQPALGGLADDLHVTRAQSYRFYEFAGVQYLGAELIVKVIGS